MRTALLLLVLSCTNLSCAAHRSAAGSAGSGGAKEPAAEAWAARALATIPVLLVQLAASEDGYRLAGVSETRGAATLSPWKNRAVSLTAVDERGETVATLFVDNPRLARTTSTPHLNRTLPTGMLRVRLPEPQRIRSLQVVVRDGPNAGLETVFELPGKRALK